MHPVAVTLSIITAIVFLLAGVPMLARHPVAVGSLTRLRIADSAAPRLGLLEIAGALGLLIGVAAARWLAILAALGLTVMMITAVQLHRRQNDGVVAIGPAAVCLALAFLTSLTLLFA